MNTQTCRSCRWLGSLLKGYENDYWVCTFAPIPRPYFELVSALIKPGMVVLSIGDPESKYGELCATYKAKERER